NSLLLIAADCAERLGETAAEERIVALLERIAGETADPDERGSALLRVAGRQRRQGRIAAAEESFAAAATAFGLAGSERDWAIARGGIADILQARGELDEALRILADEVLSAFDHLGDVRSKAVTQGQIADILQARGELDEALRIRVEEELPVYARLGDVREKALTQGRIADILQARGELDEALRIRVEEELPVYERLGDVRSKAVTQGNIAGALQARGQFAQALALHEERLPVAERMRDIEGIAHIKYSTAMLRLQLGQHTSGGLQRIYDDLAESFALSRQLGRPDFIGGVGQRLAQVLALAGEREWALEVLTLAEQAFVKIKDADGLAQVRELRGEIGGS
ncbi:MAG: tetratricopeptide repeat protein, partial [Candidatus Accumulibacter sp.]|nr:tetratricopeptide repeat protein [Accumulibacter sp.]